MTEEKMSYWQSSLWPADQPAVCCVLLFQSLAVPNTQYILWCTLFQKHT